jgi:hypothetical protein
MDSKVKANGRFKVGGDSLTDINTCIHGFGAKAKERDGK